MKKLIELEEKKLNNFNSILYILLVTVKYIEANYK